MRDLIDALGPDGELAALSPEMVDLHPPDAPRLHGISPLYCSSSSGSQEDTAAWDLRPRQENQKARRSPHKAPGPCVGKLDLSGVRPYDDPHTRGPRPSHDGRFKAWNDIESNSRSAPQVTRPHPSLPATRHGSSPQLPVKSRNMARGGEGGAHPRSPLGPNSLSKMGKSRMSPKKSPRASSHGSSGSSGEGSRPCQSPTLLSPLGSSFGSSHGNIKSSQQREGPIFFHTRVGGGLTIIEFDQNTGHSSSDEEPSSGKSSTNDPHTRHHY